MTLTCQLRPTLYPGQSTLIKLRPWNTLLDALAGVAPGDFAGLPPKYSEGK